MFGAWCDKQSLDLDKCDVSLQKRNSSHFKNAWLQPKVVRFELFSSFIISCMKPEVKVQKPEMLTEGLAISW